jgi:hypothetical protein
VLTCHTINSDEKLKFINERGLFSDISPSTNNEFKNQKEIISDDEVVDEDKEL